MTLSLDSNVVIDIINRRSDLVRRRFEQALASDEPVVLSSLVINEVSFGALISRRPVEQTRWLEALAEPLSVVPFTVHDARAAAEVRRALKLAGTSINGLDPLIAGQALGRGWTMVTSNVRDFQRVEGLSVIDWSAA